MLRIVETDEIVDQVTELPPWFDAFNHEIVVTTGGIEEMKVPHTFPRIFWPSEAKYPNGFEKVLANSGTSDNI